MIINRSDCLINAQFEDNVTNSVPSGTNGTVSGTTQYANGVSGRAFDFDDATSIAFGNSSLSNSSDLTIFMKLNLDAHTTGDNIIAKSAESVNNGFQFLIWSSGTDELRFRVRNALDSAWVSTSLTLAEINPYAIRLEINLGSEITISSYTAAGVYSAATTAFGNSTYTSNADNITIGNQSSPTNNWIDGTMDDFTVITSILTDDDFYRYYLGMGITDL